MQKVQYCTFVTGNGKQTAAPSRMPQLVHECHSFHQALAKVYVYAVKTFLFRYVPAKGEKFKPSPLGLMHDPNL